jgi:hypothetical protein
LAAATRELTVALDWKPVGDGREATAGGIVYRAAPGGGSKFFLAWADEEVIGQAPTLSGAQALCEAAARRADQ